MTDIHLHIDEIPNLCNAKFDDLSEYTINAFSPSMILPVRIFLIGFASFGIKAEHLGLYESETQTGLLRDVDVIISFQARYHRGRATMPSKRLVEVLLQVVCTQVSMMILCSFVSFL